MMNFAVSTALLIGFQVSVYGWGRLVERLLYCRATGSWAYTVALGLVGLILIGGILNLLNVAYPTALEILLGMGLVAAIAFAVRAIRRDASVDAPSILTRRKGLVLKVFGRFPGR